MGSIGNVKYLDNRLAAGKKPVFKAKELTMGPLGPMGINYVTFLLAL